MPLGDVAEKQLVLDALFGANHSSVMPDSHDLALFTGNPFDGGAETDYPGYARQTIDNDATWPAADTDATKTVEVSFPDATDAASDDILCWVLFNGTAITAWEFLDAPISVDGAGTLDPIGVTVYVPDDANLDA